MTASDPPGLGLRPAQPGPGGALDAVIRQEAEAAVAYALEALAPATRRAYRSDYRRFAAWCAARGLVAVPAVPETVAAFSPPKRRPA